jgi:pyocin large subunit-like protein
MRNAGLLAAGLALAVAAITLVPRPVHHAPRPRMVVPQAPIETEYTPARPEIGFRTRERLVEHYRKHGREFGSINMDRYLRLAQALRDRPAGGMILEAVRGDGVTVRYDKSSGAFIAFNRDGTIRSFFRPDRGDAYFRSQLRRGQ